MTETIDYEYDQTKRLMHLAEVACGLRYDSAEAQSIMNSDDWANYWPVVDADGALTGAVVETEDCDGMANVDDIAMVYLHNLKLSQVEASGGMEAIRENGYAIL